MTFITINKFLDKIKPKQIKFGNKIFNFESFNLHTKKIVKILNNRGIKRQNKVLIICDNNHYLLIPVIFGILKLESIYTIVKKTDKLLNEKIKLLEPSLIMTINIEGVKYNNCVNLNLDYFIKLKLSDIKNYTEPNPKLKLNDYMYITFTSGSSGVPKMVKGKYKPIINFFNWFLKTFQFNGVSNFLLSASIDHDPVIRNIFTPLLLEKNLIIPCEPIINLIQTNKFSWYIQNNDIEVLFLIPTYIQIFEENIKLNKVKYLFFGGENLNYFCVNKSRSIFPNSKLINTYGATETPQIITYKILDNNVKNYKNKSIPLGKCIDGFKIEINDPDKNSKEGEIIIKSEYLAEYNKKNGKFNNVYNTGDIGFFNENGDLFFKSRKLVKVNGNRIDMIRIEELIRTIPIIKDVYLTFTTHFMTTLKENLHCTFILHDENYEENKAIVDIYKFLVKKLNVDSIPIWYKKLNSFNYLLNGKLDKKIVNQEDYLLYSESLVNLGEFSTEFSINNLKKIMFDNFDIDIKNHDIELTSYGLNSINILSLCTIIDNSFSVKIYPFDIYKNNSLNKLHDYLSKLINSKKSSSIIVDEHYEYHRTNLLSKVLFVFFTGRAGLVGTLDISYFSELNVNYLVFIDKSLRYHYFNDCEQTIKNIKNRHNYKYLVGVSSSMGGVYHLINLDLFNFNLVCNSPYAEESSRFKKYVGDNDYYNKLQNIKLNSQVIIATGNADFDIKYARSIIKCLNKKYKQNNKYIKNIKRDTGKKHLFFKDGDQNLFFKDPLDNFYKNYNIENISIKVEYTNIIVIDFGNGGEYFLKNIHAKNVLFENIRNDDYLNENYLQEKIIEILNKYQNNCYIFIGSFTLSLFYLKIKQNFGNNINTIYNIYSDNIKNYIQNTNIVGNNIKFEILCTTSSFRNSNNILRIFQNFNLGHNIKIVPLKDLDYLIDNMFEKSCEVFRSVINESINNSQSNIIFIPFCTHYFKLNEEFENFMIESNYKDYIYKYLIIPFNIQGIL
jgi:acyl-coenzyme A synthetase/AMP-(fatty) acid ligase/acyl carrier protein